MQHGFCKRIEDWSFTSFEVIKPEKKTLINREGVLRLFGTKADFVEFHLKTTTKWLNEMEKEFE